MDHRALLLSLRDLLASAQTLVQHMLTLEGASDALVTPAPHERAALPAPQAALPPGPSRSEGPSRTDGPSRWEGQGASPGSTPGTMGDATAPDAAPSAKPPRDRSAQKQALQAFWAKLTPEDRAARIARMQGARKKKT